MNEREIFVAALNQQDPAARGAFLSGACGNNDALHQRVESLLAEHEQLGSFMEVPSSAVTVNPSVVERIGTTIGPYKLLQQVGEGGMGVVYMAEQTEPVERRVALKIVKPGMDSRQVVARFEAERQALAMMDHPNIAKVFEAGTTESRRPYFVMELVKGIPITKYCDEKRLSLKARLELLIPVCQAIQHAHQKGIIHRDIKPNNVLVAQYDGKPVPKVIDFGVAKATAQKLTEKTMFTELGQIVGTIEYMSPEQAELNQLDIDTRSDIYSLGVLLYELLTGSTPFDKQKLRTAAFHEMLRIIREDEPPRPSTNLSTSGTLPAIAASRSMEPARLSKTVRGELDWIVMKALEKDRNRRYETATGLAADLQRYLNNEAVLACPPSTSYRFGKFLRRHKSGFVIAGLLSTLLALVVGVTSTMYVQKASNERRLAELVQQSLVAATTSIEAGNLNLAGQHLAEAQGRLGDHRASLLEMAAKVDKLAAELDARQTDREKFERFVDLTGQAHAILGGSDNNNGPILAEKSLQVFGIGDDPGWIARLNQSYLTPEEKRKVIESAYETLVSLADHGVRWNHTKGNNPQSLRRSLELLDQANAFHEPTRAFWFVRRNAHYGLKEDAAGKKDDQQFRAAKGVYAWDYYLPGHSAAWGGNLNEAIRSYQMALRVQPDHYHSLFYLANRLATNEINRRPEAIAYSSACIALQPHHIYAYFDRARCYEKMGLLEESEADLSAAIAAADNDGDRYVASMWRWDFYQRMGRMKEAQEGIRQAIAHLEQSVAKSANLGQSNASALNQLAWRLATFPDPKYRDASRAVQLATKANQLSPSDGSIWNTLGVARYRVGDFQGAISALEKSSQLRNGGDSFDWFFLAMSHRQLGNDEEAHKRYGQAVMWMEANKNMTLDVELRRFRAEAAEVLGIKYETKPEEESPPNPSER